MPDLISGVILTQWLTLELLDRAGVLPKATALQFFQDTLSKLEPDLASSLVSAPLRQIVQRLEQPSPPDGSPMWTPVVIQGGKDDDNV